MRIKDALKDKLRRNKILALLFTSFIFTTIIGSYYNIIKDSRIIYHYSFKNSADKKERILFNLSSEFDENKEIKEELFRYKTDSIVNLYQNKAYFISSEVGFDRILAYNFSNKDIQVIFDNNDRLNLQDMFILDNQLFILSTNSITKLDLLTKNSTSFGLETREFEQFINISNDEVGLSLKNCNFRSEPCFNNMPQEILVFNLKDKQTKIITTDELIAEFMKSKLYIGVNKFYRLGILNTYKDTKEVKNYNLRFFTQP